MFSLHAPIMLWGLAGLSLPVIAHLLRRGVAERFHFPTVWLLEQSAKEAAAGARLWRYLLLLLRILALSLLVLAFARPQTQNPDALLPTTSNAAAATDGALTLIVLDASMSMGQSVDGIAVWPQAIVAAQRVVDQLQAGSERCQVWSVQGRVRPLLPGPTRNLDAVRDALAKQLATGPSESGSSTDQATLTQAIQRGLDTLDTRNGGRLVVISDQNLAIQLNSAHPIEARTLAMGQNENTTTTPISQPLRENLAVVSVQSVDDAVVNRSSTIRIELKRFGVTPAAAQVQLALGNTPIARSEQLIVPANGRAAIELPVTWPAAQTGWQRVEAVLLPPAASAQTPNANPDDLTTDNHLATGVWVRSAQQIPVTLAGDAQDPSAAALATLAISPFGDQRDALQAIARPTDTPSGLIENDARVAVRMGGQTLNDAWRAWVANGGRLIWWPDAPSAGSSAVNWRNQPLNSPLVIQGEDLGATQGLDAQALIKLNAATLNTGRWSGLDAINGAPWLTDTQGQPLIVEEVVGRGRLLVIGLPVRPLAQTGWLVPLLQSSLRALRPAMENPVVGEPGRPVRLNAGSEANDVAPRVIGPDGSEPTGIRRTRSINTGNATSGGATSGGSGGGASGGWRADFVPRARGLYVMGRGDREGSAALIQTPEAESDLYALLKPLAIQWRSNQLPEDGSGSWTESVSSALSLDGLSKPGTIEWWPLCLALAGGLMLIELLLAGKAVRA